MTSAEQPGERIIFLDFDGVLNSTEYALHHQVRGGLPTFDPAAIARLNRIATEAKAQIVISSNWRRLLTRERLRAVLREAGVTAVVIGQTRDLGGNHSFEIQHWLYVTERRIESFVILDDDPWMNPLDDRLVLTDWRTGLLDDHVDAAIAILRNPLAAVSAAPERRAMEAERCER